VVSFFGFVFWLFSSSVILFPLILLSDAASDAYTVNGLIACKIFGTTAFYPPVWRNTPQLPVKAGSTAAKSLEAVNKARFLILELPVVSKITTLFHIQTGPIKSDTFQMMKHIYWLLRTLFCL
jgi:hypothetical protein